VFRETWVKGKMTMAKEVRYETELFFEHLLDGAEDEDGSRISGLEVTENRFQREQGEHLPQDLQGGDWLISAHPYDRLIDPKEKAWRAKHEAERERLISTSTSGEHRNLLIAGHEMMRTCSGDASNFIEPEAGPAFATPKAPATPMVVRKGRDRRANITKSQSLRSPNPIQPCIIGIAAMQTCRMMCRFTEKRLVFGCFFRQLSRRTPNLFDFGIFVFSGSATRSTLPP
jgi:hypothetical protein